MPRKKPYSGKQKKQQLQVKRNKKGSSDQNLKSTWPQLSSHSTEHSDASQGSTSDKLKLNQKVSSEYDPTRYRLNFLRESRGEVERRKYESQTQPIDFVVEQQMEVDIKNIYRPGSVLDMPKRPQWKYTMSKEQVEHREAIYFEKYLKNIHGEFGGKNLSYFEHNLETWRQAWRVLEMSDIVVMVTDVRHPVLHFSPALYDYVVNDLHKPMLLVLNKIDLVPATVISAWTSYFKELFPHLHVVWFTSFPQDVRTLDPTQKLKKRYKPKKRVYSTQIGPKELYELCKKICGNNVDLSSWALKIDEDLASLGFQSNDTSPSHSKASGDAGQINIVSWKSQTENYKPFEDGILTVGFVGHPNVGKSSLMNGLIGRKVVSTSVTPGHTKYFQTYFLTKTVKLCDSPGLVFPSLIPKQFQILSGIYPIAQVQEPYTPVGYLAARVPVVQILQLKHPSSSSNDPDWTPWDICEAWALQRRYMTAKAARPDVYRAANSILRLAVDGRLCMYMRPPGYTDRQEFWAHHPDTSGLLKLQATGHFHGAVDGKFNMEEFYSSDSVATTGYSEDDEEDGSETEEENDPDVTLVEEEGSFTNHFAVLDIEGEDSDEE